jgi:hypothetical protein
VCQARRSARPIARPLNAAWRRPAWLSSLGPPMELKADASIPFAREIVFAAYRDDLLLLLPYLPNVRSIDVKSRKEDGQVIEFVNEWHGGGDIPAAVRAFLSDAMLSWTDYATWRADEFCCDWRTETHALAEALRCQGRTRCVGDGPGKTLLEVRASLEIDARKIRGVPSFLASKVGRTVEEFLVTKIQTNLIETAKGLGRYLAEKEKDK